MCEDVWECVGVWGYYPTTLLPYYPTTLLPYYPTTLLPYYSVRKPLIETWM